MDFRYIFLFLVFSFLSLEAQSFVRIEGRVYDREDKEPVIGAKVKLGEKNIKITNSEGAFFFDLEQFPEKEILEIIFTGYQKEQIKIQKNKYNYKIFLKTQTQDLATVSVTAQKGENLAHRLLEGIQKKRLNYHFLTYNAYGYERYHKMSVYGDNFSEKWTQKGLLSPFHQVIQDYSDTLNGKVYIPFLMFEQKTQHYVRLKPTKLERETILGQKKSVFKRVKIETYITDLTNNIDFQDDFLEIAGKNFVSPFSKFALTHYHFTVIDSVLDLENKLYQVAYFPKNEADLTFKGEFWVEDETFFISKLTAEASGKINVNYLQDFNFYLEYIKITPEIFAVKAQYLEANFKIVPEYLGRAAEKSIGIFGKITTLYEDYQLDPEPMLLQKHPPEDWTEAQWKKERFVPLSESEINTYLLADTITKIPRYKILKDGLRFLGQGYVPVKFVEFGDLWNFYTYNAVEEHRFSLSLRNNLELHPDLRLTAYGAYGLGDHAWKYGGSALIFIDKNRWEFFQVKFSSDVEDLTNPPTQNPAYLNAMSSMFLINEVIAGFAIRPGLYRILPYVKAERVSFTYGRDFLPGFSFSAGLHRTHLQPLGNLQWFQIGSLEEIKDVSDFKIRIFLSYQYKPVYITRDYFRVLSRKYTYPLVSLELETGLPNFLGSYLYEKIKLSFEQYFFIGSAGESMLALEFGKIFGRTPYMFNFLHDGNPSYIFQSYGFNTMNVGEFVSDEYVSLKLEHNFNGLVLDKIPGLRRLKWRGVVGTRLITGSMPYLYQLIPSMPFFTFKNYVPLVEFNAGIDNIFHVLRVDAVFRATYLDHPNVYKAGVRASINLKL